MQNTANLDIPLIMPSQAQKHVTHNEGMQLLDTVVQLSVLDRERLQAPDEPGQGERHLVGAGATGAWVNQDDRIAVFEDSAWSFLSPRTGWLCWVAQEDRLVAFDGTGWILAGGELNPVPRIGINTTADDVNRLALASQASLFTHDGEGHQLKINKSTAADTATVLFQTGYSGRAEMGLAGDDDYRFKVSSDGLAWHDAIRIEAATGNVVFPNRILPGFETAYENDSQEVPAGEHTVVSGAAPGLDEMVDTTWSAGEWTVGEAGAGIWQLSSFAQFNTCNRALLTLEVRREGNSDWDVLYRVQDEGETEISRTVSFSPMIAMADGDSFRFTVLQENETNSSSPLRFFTAAGRRIA